MTPTAPCGTATCPVPAPSDTLVGNVADYLMPRATSLARGHTHRHPPDAMPPPGVGSPGRFSPLPDVAHTYVARTATAALLETALRDVTPAASTVYRPDLAPWAYTNVTTTAALHLADLRDDALGDYGIPRASLAAAPPSHYRCTRRWASALHAAGFHGVIWHSRQADLHHAAQATHGLAATLLTHSPIEVAVIWTPPAATQPLATAGTPTRLIDGRGHVARLVIELAVLLDVVVEV